MTGTILDTMPPEPWWRVNKRRPTALDLAIADLQESERNLLNHKRDAEYHAAMATMLEKRIARLKKDAVRLTQDRTATSFFKSAEGENYGDQPS